ncbi:MAG: TetR/AcrR family transcriptional regulator [Planctomycetota bacterium]
MKEQILDAAEQLVQARGLSGVSFQELADKVGLRKPSIFHHIKNKDELSQLLIERCSTKHGPRYLQIIDQDVDAPAKLKAIAKLFKDDVIEGHPCLLAALGHSLDSMTEEAVSMLQHTAEGSISRFALIFKQGREEGSLEFKGKPETAAMGFFAMLQGLQTLCRAKADTSAFHQAATTYIQAITAGK